MFKWLADMLVKTPVQSSCSCCEGKKQRLQKMQEAILSGDIEGEPQSTEDAVMTCDTPEHEYAGKILGSAFYGGYPVEVRTVPAVTARIPAAAAVAATVNKLSRFGRGDILP